MHALEFFYTSHIDIKNLHTILLGHTFKINKAPIIDSRLLCKHPHHKIFNIIDDVVVETMI
jgi:hypothetical protein